MEEEWSPGSSEGTIKEEMGQVGLEESPFLDFRNDSTFVIHSGGVTERTPIRVA